MRRLIRQSSNVLSTVLLEGIHEGRIETRQLASEAEAWKSCNSEAWSRRLEQTVLPEISAGHPTIQPTKEESTMDNQHRKISGYRELSQTEIDLMNDIKAKGKELGVMIDSLRANEFLDQRWVSIGQTDLQTGLMALTRAVAKPELF